MKESILQRHDGGCYLCEKQGIYRTYKDLQKHHIYGGPNRKISEKEGFFVWLCRAHHTGDEEGNHAAVHFNKTNAQILHEDCQREYEKTHTREEFMQLIGRSYVRDMEAGSTV